MRNEKHRGDAVGRGRVAPERHCAMLLVLISVSSLREVSSFLNFDGDVLDCIYQRLFARVPFMGPSLDKVGWSCQPTMTLEAASVTSERYAQPC